MFKRVVSILAVVVMVLSVGAALAAEKRITFEWDPNQETYLGGYRLWYSINKQGGPYNGPMEEFGKVVTGSTVIDIFPGEVFYFVLTAFADPAQCPSCAESGYSNEVFFFSTTGRPGKLSGGSSGLPLEIGGKCFIDTLRITCIEESDPDGEHNP